MYKSIALRGVRVHNLKNLDLDIPRKKLIVITGVSGSGKSSLAFDTLYSEGQRRYVESLSAYARQFLERMDRPDVDEIRGISPAIAIEQKNPTKTSRSTVATATEIHDYLRLLFARIGRTFCPQCGDVVKKIQVEDVVEHLTSLEDKTLARITFRVPGKSWKEKRLALGELRERGFHRLLLDGKLSRLQELQPSQLQRARDIHILIDRIALPTQDLMRLADSVEIALREGQGRIEVITDNSPGLKFSDKFECDKCDLLFLTPQPRLFSFNNPFGACPTCRGFGEAMEIDLDLVIPDASKSLAQGAISPWNTPKRRHMLPRLAEMAARHGIDMNRPWCELGEAHQELVISGDRKFPGIRGFFKRLERKQYKIGIRVLLSRFRGYVACPDCRKMRLRPEALCVKVGGRHIGEVNEMSIQDAYNFFDHLQLSKFEERIAHQILNELNARLSYLVDVGLGYLTLARRAQTLSGGEYQRINLATAVGFKLVDSLYILDEPSIGLHPRDNRRLIKLLLALRDLGNTVIVVEHDREMMEVSDHLIDLGPHAGEHGGEIVYQGTFSKLVQNGCNTLTAKYLKDENAIPVPESRRPIGRKKIRIINARQNNLKSVTVEIPLGLFCVVTGVSGSGKSTLIHDILYARIAKHFGIWKKRVGRHERIAGIEHLQGIVLVDQSPIGRTPRSNAVTYIKAFAEIRSLLAQTLRAQARGMNPGTFSFNTKGGRCERCEGSGVEKVEMQFLADLYLQCEVCDGKRYTRDVLNIVYKGKNVFDILNMTVSQAMKFFHLTPRVLRKLAPLEQVGLGYIRLGQPATTLSGGEAQRVKLASYLARKSDEHYFYLFDEPTTGLHFHDIANLLACFQRLLACGNSVLVIEHNPDVIKCADYVIDLGPEGGDAGGEVVAMGTPEEIAQCEGSYTGQYLRKYLETGVALQALGSTGV